MDETPGKMYALATVLTALATVAVVLRFYARSLKQTSPSWDDFLIVLALVESPCDVSVIIVLIRILLLGLHHRDRNLHVRW